MNKLQKLVGKSVQRVIDRAMGSAPSLAEEVPEAQRFRAEGIEALIRQAGAEGCVLLKNDGTLPLRPERRLAVFGRCQLDGFAVGYGSGGNIRAPYVRSLIDGLEAAGVRLDRSLLLRYRQWAAQPGNEADKGWWGNWPFHYPEMPLDPGTVGRAARGALRAPSSPIGGCSAREARNSPPCATTPTVSARAWTFSCRATCAIPPGAIGRTAAFSRASGRTGASPGASWSAAPAACSPCSCVSAPDLCGRAKRPRLVRAWVFDV